MTRQSKEIESIKGRYTYLNAIFALGMTVLCAKVLVDTLIFNRYAVPWVALLISVVILIAFALGMPATLTSKVKITSEKLVKSSIYGKQELLWKDAESINAIPTLLGRYNLQVMHSGGRRSVNLVITDFSNYASLARAVAESAYEANSDIKFNKLYEAEFGTPPYNSI